MQLVMHAAMLSQLVAAKLQLLLLLLAAVANKARSVPMEIMVIQGGLK